MTAPRHLPPEPYGDVLDKALARVAELERENARLREENERAGGGADGRRQGAGEVAVMVRCPVCDAPKDPATNTDDAWHLLVCGLPMSEWPRRHQPRHRDLQRLIELVGSVVEEMAG